MSPFLFYLLKVSISLGVFYGFYKSVLSNSSFYQWNRFFLLGTVLVSLFIPLMPTPDFSSGEVSVSPDSFMLGVQTMLADNGKEVTRMATSFSVLHALLFVYMLGATICLTRFLLNMYKLWVFIRKSKGTTEGKYTLIETDYLPTSSFFNYIFINQQGLSRHDLAQVIAHEKVHGAEKHSLDVLLMSLLQVFLWFNPFVGLMRKTIEELHEYRVDQKVVQHVAIPRYSRLLLQLATQVHGIRLTSSFAKIQLKKRIVMLNRAKTSDTRKFRFLLAIPLLAGMLLVLAAGKPSTQKLIVGTWTGADITLKALNKQATIDPAFFEANKETYQQTSYTLNADGTMHMQGPKTKTDGTWKINGRQLEMSVGLGKMNITQVTRNKLILSVFASLETGEATKSQQGADFELKYILVKK